MKQVKQIIPAGHGWWACYEDEEQDDGIWVTPVVCWAVVEDEHGDSFVVGMDADSSIAACEDVSNFLGFTGPGQSTDLYRKDS